MVRKSKVKDNKAFSRNRRVYLYRAAVQRALIQLCLSKGQATTDEVHQTVPLPDGVHRNNFGLAVGQLAQGGIVKFAGVELTTRRSGHGRLIRKWVLPDVDGARQWLASAANSNGEVPE